MPIQKSDILFKLQQKCTSITYEVCGSIDLELHSIIKWPKRIYLRNLECFQPFDWMTFSQGYYKYKLFTANNINILALKETYQHLGWKVTLTKSWFFGWYLEFNV